MKTWSYKAITEEAERQIKSLLEDAARRSGDEARVYRQWAYGVYLMWDRLTIGWREEGDTERMKALVERH